MSEAPVTPSWSGARHRGPVFLGLRLHGEVGETEELMDYEGGATEAHA